MGVVLVKAFSEFTVCVPSPNIICLKISSFKPKIMFSRGLWPIFQLMRHEAQGLMDTTPKIIPLRGPTCKLRTCKDLSKAEIPSWTRVWQYIEDTDTFQTPTDTFQTPSRHLPDTLQKWVSGWCWLAKFGSKKSLGPDTFQTRSRHLPDTFQTPSRHHPDTIKTQSRHQSSSCVKLSSHTKFQLSKSCRSPKQIYMVGFRGGAAAGGKKICLII